MTEQEPIEAVKALTDDECRYALYTMSPLEELQEMWLDWQIWVVPVYLGADRWCARRHDDHRTVINADSPQELAGYLAEASA
jgi:hypothetical protein